MVRAQKVYWHEKIVKEGGFFAFEQEDHEDDEMAGDLANANRPGTVRVCMSFDSCSSLPPPPKVC